MTPERMRRAAEVLEREAEFIRDTAMFDEEWPEDDAHSQADHDEMLALAAELRQEAEQKEKS